jgi:2'-5' RNA ligase
MTTHKRRRLFIGLAYQPGERVSGVLESLRVLAASPGAGVRPVAPENLHITLKFLGMIPESDIPLLSQVMDQALAAEAGLELRLAGIGYFKQAIWLGVEPDVRLDALVTRLNRFLAVVGCQPDNKPFVPHLTVARLRPDHRVDLSALREQYADREWEGLQAGAVNLYESRTLPDGVRYEVLQSVSLLR